VTPSVNTQDPTSTLSPLGTPTYGMSPVLRSSNNMPPIPEMPPLPTGPLLRQVACSGTLSRSSSAGNN
jgi:hypothetical protein